MVKLYTIFDKELNQRMFYLMDNYRRVVVTSIDLDADKESASYGESVTFTAVVTDKDNNPVSGSTVSFYNINSRLGAAISNENGVATFSYVVRHDLSVNARADDVQSNTVAVTMDEDVYELVLSCDAPIIESGGSTSVNCLLTHNGGAVSGESLNYIINHGSTTIDSGSVTTGSDGTASISYTGTGVGDVSVIVSYGSLLQETYEVIDAIYFDSASSDNTSRYAFNTSVGNSLTFEDGYYLMTGGNSSRYINYTMSNVSALIGKTIRIEADLNTSDNVALGIFPHNSEGYVNHLSNWFEGEGTFHFDVELSDTTMDSCLFRVYVKTTNATVEIKNFKIYPISTYKLSIESDKDILSAHDGESATITALLTKDNIPIEDIELEYSIKHGNTVIDSGTITTDSDGEANIVYTASGVGDVDIVVSYGTLLQKTYELEDCDIYDTTEHTKSYSTTKFETIASITDLSDVSISLDLKTTTYNYSCVFGIGYNSESDQIGFGTTDTVGRIYRTLNGINNHLNYSQFNQNNVYYNLRFERTGNTLKTYLNNVLIDTSTDNEISTFTYLNFGSWRTKTIYYKNLKVKAL